MSLHALRDTNSMEGKAEYTPWLAQATQQTESLSGLPSPTFTPLTPQALRVYILASSASAPQLLSLCPRACAPQQEKPQQRESPEVRLAVRNAEEA